MSSIFGDNPLVIASHNEGKVREIGELIAPLGIKAISASAAHIEEPEETGNSFAENAALKALNDAAHYLPLASAPLVQNGIAFGFP